MSQLLQFNIYYTTIASAWITGVLLMVLFKSRKIIITGHILLNLGFAILILFITFLWIYLQRAPIHSQGETRLWFSLLFTAIGYIIFILRKLKWFMVFNIIIALTVLYINVFYPENFVKTQLPAQDSPWFFPYQITCLLAYSFLIVSSQVGYKGLIEFIFKKLKPETLILAGNLVYFGFSFLTFGILLGGIWSKQTIGHYSSWTESETWTAITWLVYLIYIHIRNYPVKQQIVQICFLCLAFIVPVICWIGNLKYLISLFIN